MDLEEMHLNGGLKDKRGVAALNHGSLRHKRGGFKQDIRCSGAYNSGQCPAGQGNRPFHGSCSKHDLAGQQAVTPPIHADIHAVGSHVPYVGARGEHRTAVLKSLKQRQPGAVIRAKLSRQRRGTDTPVICPPASD